MVRPKKYEDRKKITLYGESEEIEKLKDLGYNMTKLFWQGITAMNEGKWEYKHR